MLETLVERNNITIFFNIGLLSFHIVFKVVIVYAFPSILDIYH